MPISSCTHDGGASFSTPSVGFALDNPAAAAGILTRGDLQSLHQHHERLDNGRRRPRITETGSAGRGASQQQPTADRLGADAGSTTSMLTICPMATWGDFELQELR